MVELHPLSFSTDVGRNLAKDPLLTMDYLIKQPELSVFDTPVRFAVYPDLSRIAPFSPRHRERDVWNLKSPLHNFTSATCGLNVSSVSFGKTMKLSYPVITFIAGVEHVLLF